jgi:hypothetical protein
MGGEEEAGIWSDAIAGAIQDAKDEIHLELVCPPVCFSIVDTAQ